MPIECIIALKYKVTIEKYKLKLYNRKGNDKYRKQ